MSAGISRRGRRLRKAQLHVGPNMTPMVDVVLCILIFFMLGSSFIMKEQFLTSNTVAVDKGGLGSDTSPKKLPSAKFWIELTRQGDNTWVKAGESTPMQMSHLADKDSANTPDDTANEQILASLKGRRATMSDDVQVLILPHERVPYQDVITIYDYCTKLAFKQVAFCPAKGE